MLIEIDGFPFLFDEADHPRVAAGSPVSGGTGKRIVFELEQI
jgi:hypothetical protein